MEMETQPQPVAIPQKRPFEEDVPAPVTPPRKSEASSETPDTPLSVLSSIVTPSPLKQHNVSQAPIPAPALNPTSANAMPAPASSNDAHPAKRRKLTDKEKEEKRLEKEAKEKEKEKKRLEKEANEKLKAEQKAQREEEKRKKDEEKRKKNEEKEEKRRAKEQEQQQKEEEKRKKERSQMRLGAFFGKPKTDAKSSGTALVDANQNIINNTPSSLSDAPVQNANSAPTSPQKAFKQNAKSDYDRYFLPFQLPSTAIMAPNNQYMEDPEKRATAMSRLENLISQQDATMESVNLRGTFGRPRRRGIQMASIVQIVNRLNGSSDNPIDLTTQGGSQDPLKLLKQIPMKYLHFGEDVRPPYYGTYTKPHATHEEAKLARNPFSRSLHEADYDYDSEAEWEEPEEGEDLDSDGEEDADDSGDEEMEDFLDDEEDTQVKRRLINTDLEPVSTGICWEDAQGVSKDDSGAISTEFKEFKMGFLLQPQPTSIDPFSTAYWAPPPPPVTAPTSTPKDGTITSMMQPPRLPLPQRPVNSMMNSLNTTPLKAASGKRGKQPRPAGVQRMVPPDQLAAFKAEIEGKDHTKVAMIEALKKAFPSLPKDAIQNTLETVAARVGAKQKEKRWVLI